MISKNRAIYVFHCLLWCGLTFLRHTVIKFCFKHWNTGILQQKGPRGLFIFHIQVDGSVFLLGTKAANDSNVYPMVYNDIFRHSRGRGP